MLEGPQVVEGREDAVSSQSEVDDLLSELGF
jgi:chemotaxis regulatin CheY-phosphate phosphatase CheZ